jgi:ADP-heptose:LPS heptosyltransferase
LNPGQVSFVAGCAEWAVNPMSIAGHVEDCATSRAGSVHLHGFSPVSNVDNFTSFSGFATIGKAYINVIGRYYKMFLNPFGRREIVPDIRKIAVLRANAIGDYIFTLPALVALRQAYPQAEITLVGRDWHRDFLNGRPGPYDRVVAVPDERVLRGWVNISSQKVEETEHFLEGMAAENFDMALQLYGGGRYSNPFISRFKARLTVGLKSADAVPLDRWVPYIYFQSEVMRFLEVVSLVGASPVVFEPFFDLIEKDFEEAEHYLPGEDRPFAALQPGAGDPRRRWPVEKFAAVGDALVREGVSVVITGADDDRPLVEGVAEDMHASPILAYNALSLGGLGALFSRAAVVIGNDSGPIHLAAAVGANTVPIFWCANLLNSSQFTRTKHRPVISWQVHCPECGTNTLEKPCQHPVSFVSGIEVDQVLENAMALIRQANRATYHT